MPYPRSLLCGLSAFALAVPACAVGPSSQGSLYLRTRAAEALGDMQGANAGFAALMTQDPGNRMVADQAYSQAVLGGNMALAVRAAHILEAQKALRSDTKMLLVLEQMKAHDWVKARALTEELAFDRRFGFFAPYLRAWIAVGSGQGDAIALIEGARTLPLAALYYPEQRALLLIALGRNAEAANSLGPQAATQLPAHVKGAGEGLSPLLVHVAIDFARQQYLSDGLIMARMATYVAPDNGAGWVVLAELLQRMDRAELALSALSQVDPANPVADDARAVRISLLNNSGKHQQALDEALAVTKRPDADADDWSRAGDLYLIVGKPAEAAQAYAKALARAEARQAPAEALWPILLQQGGALDLAGDWPAAKAAYERAYAIAPDQPSVLNQVGYSEIEHRENIAAASAMIAKASSLRPDDPAITDSQGWVLYLQGKPADAIPLLEKAATGDPGEAAINEHLGDAYWATGRIYEARYAWRAALLTADDKDKARLTSKIDIGFDKATAAP